MQLIADISVTEEQIDLLDIAENFCRDHSPMEKVRALIEDDRGYDPEVWKRICELGWLAVTIPEEYDGVGLGLGEVVPIAEQMGRYMLNSPFLSTTLAAQALIVGGTKAQKQHYLPLIATGTGGTLALCENSGDWDLTRIEASARKGKNGLVLSGRKTFVMDLPAASFMIASVLLDGEPALVLVDTDVIDPKAIRREVLIDETKRGYEVVLDGIEIREDQVLDRSLISQTLDHIHLAANLLASAELCGACKSTIEYTVEYLKTRRQFGKLIGSYQALKHPTVDAFVEYEQARSHLYAAAANFNQQGQGEIATRMAKAQSDKALSFAADRSIQFHGGFGFTYDCDAQLYRRRAIFHSSQYGDAAYHRRKLADLLF